MINAISIYYVNTLYMSTASKTCNWFDILSTNKKIENKTNNSSGSYTTNLAAVTSSSSTSKGGSDWNTNNTRTYLNRLKRRHLFAPQPTKDNPYNFSVVAGCFCK